MNAEADMRRAQMGREGGGVFPFFLAVVLLFCIAMYLRVTPYLAEPSFWAEDLSVFWAAAYVKPLHETLFVPYAGYLHLVPRLIAAGVELFPYKLHPTLYAYASVAVSAWTAGVLATSAGTRVLGALWALLLLLVPHAGEVWATPTNLQWVMACALPVLALAPVSTSRFVRGNQIAFMATTALTGPFMVLSAPLWAYRAARAWRSRDGHGAVLVAIAAAGAAVQFYFLTRQSVAAAVEGGGVSDFSGTLLHCLQRWLEQSTGPLSILSLMFGPLLLAGLFWGSARVLRAGCLAFALIVLLATTHKFSTVPNPLAETNGDRYFFIPMVMAGFSFASLILDGAASRWLRAAAVILLLQMMFLALLAPLSEREPWDFARNWRGYAHLIGRQDILVTFPPNWQFLIKAK
ncbi:hypothetical protein V5F77_20805 [Xanthobacter sp. DSM 24535]|uniref:hypothetical protein n=1 Tax=Roseixanthobacter psychrophilus TaxID=3119917 RepID=UPI0037291557